jgi:hypothetical protein
MQLADKILDVLNRGSVRVVSDYDNSLVMQIPLNEGSKVILDQAHRSPVKLRFHDGNCYSDDQFELTSTLGVHSPRGILSTDARVTISELQVNLKKTAGDFDILTAGDFLSVDHSINGSNGSKPFKPGFFSSGYGGIINNEGLIYPSSYRKAVANIEYLKEKLGSFLGDCEINASMQSGCQNIIAILFDPNECDGQNLSEVIRKRLREESKDQGIYFYEPGAFFLDITMADDLGNPSTKNVGFRFIVSQWERGLVAAGINKVVIAIGDSNPDVDMFEENQRWAETDPESREAINIQIGSKSLRNPDSVHYRLESPEELLSVMRLVNDRLRR